MLGGAVARRRPRAGGRPSPARPARTGSARRIELRALDVDPRVVEAAGRPGSSSRRRSRRRRRWPAGRRSRRACRSARSGPCFITTIRSDMVSASSWSCVTMIVVMPRRPLQIADFAAQPGAHPRIERRQRLVEQQQTRRERQRARQRHPLLLAAGELGRIFVGLLGQADERQQLGHAPVDLCPRQALADQAVADIVRDGEIGKQRIGLEHDAEVAPADRQGGNVASILLRWCRRSGRRAPRSRAAKWSCRSPTGRGTTRTRRRQMSRSTSSSAVN